MNLQVINSNCLTYLASPFAETFDLIIADPPFNIGQNYKGYNDNMRREDYIQFTANWMVECWNHLKPGGILFVHGSVKVARIFTVVIDRLQLDNCIENEIVWAYNFGQNTFEKFVDTHCRALAIRKPGQNRKWYVDNVLTESKRLLMGDKRVETSRYKGYVPYGTVWGVDDVDGFIVEPVTGQQNWGRIQGNNPERRHNHPNQLPERYIERVIQAYTLPGDTVFDPFGGSGTTIVVAQHIGRNCITTDISEFNCKSIKERMVKGAVSLWRKN